MRVQHMGKARRLQVLCIESTNERFLVIGVIQGRFLGDFAFLESCEQGLIHGLHASLRIRRDNRIDLVRFFLANLIRNIRRQQHVLPRILC